MTARRLLAALVVVALLPAGTAGCGGSPEAAPRAAREARARVEPAPRQGDCWLEADYEVVSEWSWWQGGAPVDCGDRHNSITVAVVEGAAASFEPPGPAQDERRELTDDEWATMTAVCVGGAGVDLGLREGTRAAFFWYLPSPRQWAAGQRWLRCDVAVVSLGPLETTAVDDLPPTVDDVVSFAWDARAYRLCLNTPYPAPEFMPWHELAANELVPCDGQSQWEYGVSVTFDGDEMPPTQEMGMAVARSCAELLDWRGDRTDGRIYLPSAVSWDRGSRTGTCWLY